MDSSPFISFIIPFYGSVPLLKRALDSVVAQTDGDFECIVVDDRSPDSAKDLVAQYDSRFRYVLQPVNRGPYQGRVRGIEESRGDYVVDIDCDDYVLPELVSELRKTIVRDAADIVIYNYEQDYDGDIRPHWCCYEPGLYAPADVLARFVQKKLRWNFWSKAFRRSLLLGTWQCEPALHDATVLVPDDYCSVLPAVMASRKISVIAYIGHRYYQNTGSITHALDARWLVKSVRDTLVARRHVLSYARKSGVGAEGQVAARKIAGMIIRWVWGEYKQSVKARMFRR